MAGILDIIQLGGVLILAIPAALAGFEFLVVRGQPAIGLTLLAMSALLVLIQHHLSLADSLKGLVLDWLTGSGRDERD
jgi:hypothetical protein